MNAAGRGRVGAPREVGAALAAQLEAGRPSVLVTLLAREGHGYAEPGAQLLLAWPAAAPFPDGPPPTPVAGRLSGGCLEAEVAARARAVTRGAPARTWRLDLRDDDPVGLGVACGGVLTVLAESIDPAGGDRSAWHAWADALAAGRPARRWGTDAGTCAWATPERRIVSDGAPPSLRRAAEGAPLAPAAPDVRARLRPVDGGWAHVAPAPPELVLVGADADAVAVARTLTFHGWDVTWFAPARDALAAAADAVAAAAGRRPAVRTLDARGVAATALAPDARVLVASHRLELDAAGILAASRAGVRWVGAVGSRARSGALRAAAATELGGAAADVRLEAPAGLDVGARGPEEIATAVAARLVADLRVATAP
ncbi:MAG: XdhC family protein, partial [Trueperaceae bacterium]|nr:XdhC family protein [Trueperaceae bacterium]